MRIKKPAHLFKFSLLLSCRDRLWSTSSWTMLIGWTSIHSMPRILSFSTTSSTLWSRMKKWSSFQFPNLEFSQIIWDNYLQHICWKDLLKIWIMQWIKSISLNYNWISIDQTILNKKQQTSKELTVVSCPNVSDGWFTKYTIAIDALAMSKGIRSCSISTFLR